MLIIDDWEDSALALAALLASAGYETRVARSAAAAFEMVDSDVPDAVLLDIDLPDLSGYEVCRLLRADARTTDVLIIVLTGWTRHSDRAAALMAGCDHYVVKPASFETLHALLQGIERRGRPKPD